MCRIKNIICITSNYINYLKKVIKKEGDYASIKSFTHVNYMICAERYGAIYKVNI